MHMAEITNSSFGSITIDGKRYHRDILILADGTVKKRRFHNWVFNSHTFTKKEIKELSRGQPEEIVVGIGFWHKAHLSTAAETHLKETRAELSVLPSREAVDRLRLIDTGKRMAGIIHIYC